jgi:3-oxoacyl-[acyl-carrier protein] reductase
MKIALVTGSSKGIGRAIAIRLAKEGYFIVVTYKSDEKRGMETLDQVKKRSDGMLIQLDVTEEESVRSLYQLVEKRFGKLDVLINNAGIERPFTIEECSVKDWNAVVDLKTIGLFLCTKYALPLLKAAETAHLINIVSALGKRPRYQFPAYSVGNAAAIAFTKMMALQLGQYGIRVNGIVPGSTRTALRDSFDGHDDEAWDKMAKANPLGRVAIPEDTANTIALVLTKDAEYLNGNIIYVNGGNHLM